MKQNIMIQIQGAKPKLIHAQDCIVLATSETGELQVHVNPGAPLDKLYEMLFSFLPHLMECSVPKDEDPKKQKENRVKVYDYVNMLASSLLKNFIPDHELHPDLTNEAILKAENEILEQSFNALSKEEQQAIHNNIEEAKESLKRKTEESSESDVDQ